MRAFRRALSEHDAAREASRVVYVPYDQLTLELGPLSRLTPEETRVVLIECPEKAARRPYHRQKLLLVLSNQRHFALEAAERGFEVDYRVARGSYADELRDVARDGGPILCMRPAERELRAELAPLSDEGVLELVPHEGWLTTREQFLESQDGTPWRMDAFYRRARRDSGILMGDDSKPVGGKFSFDGDNREAWSGEPPAPDVPRFEPDAITLEVCDLIRERYASHPGRLDPEGLPATRGDARELWRWARSSCMPHFGPYEDAMSTRSRNLFHTRVSSLVNLQRLLPARLIEDVLELDVELRSKEGFVRQVLGWREFMRHVHEETDGFRSTPGEYPEGEAPSFLGSEEPLPAAFWGEESGLACLDEVVRGVWDEGYSHHITRLMILSNLATLLDLSPRELTDWFWVAYTDAYDWVVEPNVLAMGTFALGDLLTTKPYVSGAAYIDRMSDYCGACAFHPKKDCPVTALYWAFLARHRDRLDGNPRLRMPFAGLKKRADEKQREDARIFAEVGRVLRAGEVLAPDGLGLRD